MIQFNLLPNVKLEYIQAQQNKRRFISLAAMVGGVSLIVFVLLFVVVNVLQRQHIKNLTNDIQRDSAKLEAIPEIDKILTIQNQLASLPELHNKKAVTTRLTEYLKQVVPVNASVAKLDVDFVNNAMTFNGAADSLGTINKFVDTLKFTDYKIGDQQQKAFSEVVLASFGRDDKGASFQIKLKYDPIIFDSSQDVKLVVPNIITTRSETEKPTDLFQPLSDTQNQGN